jgi:hypothetical protein
MSIFHRRHPDHVSEDLAATDYDAQSDLALPTASHADPIEEGFSPYAGMVTPVDQRPAYDTAS